VMVVVETKTVLIIRNQEMKKSEVNDFNNDFGDWVDNLEQMEQPACNILNPEDCEACGS
jgi:hypothetical protein